jgi:hypothetical protein
MKLKSIGERSMDDPKTKEDVLHILACNTHGFWKPEFAKKLTALFGFECRTHVEHVDPHDQKGIQFDAPEVKAAEGAASWDISGQIVRHLGIRSEGKLGRGSQVQADCDAIRAHLKGGNRANTGS